MIPAAAAQVDDAHGSDVNVRMAAVAVAFTWRKDKARALKRSAFPVPAAGGSERRVMLVEING
jgi:hypothetical protein